MRSVLFLLHLCPSICVEVWSDFLYAAGLWWHHCEENRPSSGFWYIRRTFDSRAVQHDRREVGRLPDWSELLNYPLIHGFHSCVFLYFGLALFSCHDLELVVLEVFLKKPVADRRNECCYVRICLVISSDMFLWFVYLFTPRVCSYIDLWFCNFKILVNFAYGMIHLKVLFFGMSKWNDLHGCVISFLRIWRLICIQVGFLKGNIFNLILIALTNLKATTNNSFF